MSEKSLVMQVIEESVRRRFGKKSMTDRNFNKLVDQWLKSKEQKG